MTLAFLSLEHGYDAHVPFSQDTYGKLLDTVVVSVGRGSEAGSWIRRATKDSLVVNGRDSPLPRGQSQHLSRGFRNSHFCRSSLGREVGREVGGEQCIFTGPSGVKTVFVE